MIHRATALALLFGSLLPVAAAGHLIVAEPNGGETFAVGDVVTIRWNIGIAHALQNWDLWYTLSDPTVNSVCTDLPGAWTVIEMDVAPTCTAGGGGVCSPGPCEMTYAWTIPSGTESDQVKVRVRMDNSATDYYDVSDAPFTITGASSVAGQAVPGTSFQLAQNRPNPFNPSTVISFVLERDVESVHLEVYDAGGRLVRSLVDGDLPAGVHAVTWNGIDQKGQSVPSGVYFYRLDTATEHQTRKMLLVE
ncbi:MAG: FlgD immunoglobulin-like domain containing protein [Candidatus Eiseniibacteriota bacterium]